MASLLKSVAKNAAQDIAASATQAATQKATGLAAAATEKAQNVAITTALKQAPGGSLLATLYTSFKDIGRKIKTYYQTLSPQTKSIALALIVIVIIFIAYTIYTNQQQKSKDEQIADLSKQVNENAAKLGQLKQGLDAVGLSSSLGIEGFQDCPVQVTAQKEEVKLVSLQPFSIKYAGFKGTVNSDSTAVTGGVFDEADAIQKALQAGIRTFVLHIDYLETDKTSLGFPAVNEPCLLFKDNTGELKSSNAGSIQRVCQALADHSFAATLPQKDDPVLVILYLERVPFTDVANPREYIRYLAKIGAQLSPLNTRRLGLTDKGDFTKQALEKDILTLPLNNFSRKFILATNADTTPFRSQEALNISIETANNLDIWSNMRIYKKSANANLGITSLANDSSNFILLSESEVETAVTTVDSIKIVRDSLKTKFSMMMPRPSQNPDTDIVNKALDQVGINIIPLDIFSFSTNQTIASSTPWKTNSWKLKPALLR